MFRKLSFTSSKFCMSAASATPVQKSYPQYSFLTIRHFSLVPTGKEPLYERVKLIDTTLTPEQQAYVNSIKHKLKGGIKSPKSIYREVPKLHEIQGMGNFLPRVAENAEQLIDFALSHIPKKTGPRKSREKQRIYLKTKRKLEFDQMKKAQGQAAYQRKLTKIKNKRLEVKKMWAQVHAIRDKAAAIAEFKAKNSV